MPSLRDRILLALRRLETPPGAAWSLDGDRLRRLECREGRLALEIAVDSLEQKADLDGLARAIERALLPIGGVDSVETRFCLREAPAEGDAHSPAVRFGAVVAVASAKGGVGKTTVAVRLAEALAARGRRIGLLDADLQGPNVPQMTGLRATLGVNEAANRIVPAVWRGVKIASMGLLLKETEPAVWRGPMLHSALRQLLRDVEWGDLEEGQVYGGKVIRLENFALSGTSIRKSAVSIWPAMLLCATYCRTSRLPTTPNTAPRYAAARVSFVSQIVKRV